MRNITERGLAVLQDLEGLRLVAYDDARPNYVLKHGDNVIGTLTIGYGDTNNVYIGQTITKDQAVERLLTRLESFERCVWESSKVPLKDNQFDALVIFCYNVGEEAFKNSTMLKLLNMGKYTEVPFQLLRWNKTSVKGVTVVSEGLNRRREKEIQLWNNQYPQTPQQPQTLLNKVLSWFR